MRSTLKVASPVTLTLLPNVTGLARSLLSDSVASPTVTFPVLSPAGSSTSSVPAVTVVPPV